MNPRNLVRIALFALLVFPTLAIGGDRRSDQQALKPYAGLVGSWKGTGQPQRSSARGAWRESVEWSWTLSDGSAGLRMTMEGGHYLKALTLRPGDGPGRFALDVTLADGSTRRFRGKSGPRDVVDFVTAEETGEGLARIRLTPLHENRFLILLEGRTDGGEPRRLAEVGYTRQGVAFAAGDSYPVCIVTEGRGTIRVSHRGKEYWVCCSGCKELFEDDPEGVIAEAQQRSKTKEKSSDP